MKQSACIEGARMALARVKTYWAEMDATAVHNYALFYQLLGSNLFTRRNTFYHEKSH